MTDILKSKNNVPVRYRDMDDTSYAEVVSPASNITSKFRDAFESFVPNVAGADWNATVANGDIVRVDGNCLGASYLSISRCPIGSDVFTETIVETAQTFKMPIDFSIGLHAAQRTLGQDFYVEIVDATDSLPEFQPIAISSISQATTTLTITTSAAHGAQVGQRFCVYGVPDSRLDYPSLVVASVLSTTQFTATAGPAGTIPSVTAGPYTSGFILSKSAVGRTQNGTSMALENATATNASFFVRSESGDVFPSGTVLGNQSVTIATTASVQLANVAGSYSFVPTSEYKLSLQSDRVQWSDAPIDSTGGYTARITRVQVAPDPTKHYKLRFRFGKNPSISRPVGGTIVSAVKAGSTTATITTSSAHGLSTTDFVCIYGILDQVNFANQTTAVAVASVIDAFNFTVVFGASATATSFGGAVVVVNGGNLPSTLGYTGQAIQSASLTGGVLTLTGSANWSGLLIGDFADIYGADTASGVSRGIDEAWRVRNVATNQLTLEWISPNPIPADFVNAPCSGAVIKYTCMRISFVRIFDYDRQRVEIMPRANSDASASVPVIVNNTVATTVSGTPTVTLSGTANAVGGGAAHDAVITGNPVRIGARALTAQYTPVANGDAVDLTSTTVGAFITKPFAIPEAGFNASLSLTTTTAVAIAAAAGAGIKRHLTACQAINTGAAAVDLIILDGATERWRLTLPINVPVCFDFPTEVTTTANTALNANLSAVGTVRVNFQGYTAP